MMKFKHALKSNVPFYFTEEEVTDFDNFLQSIKNLDPEEKKKRKLHFFVVVYNQKVKGCGGFGDKESKDIISLAWGLIHKDYHKKGFGKMLLVHRLNN